jgi:uncharacterized protein GlcG (DUF336 family)
VTFRQQNEAKGKTLADWGDPRLTTLSGGHPVRRAGLSLGAVGVGGGQADQDEQLAREIAELVIAG